MPLTPESIRVLEQLKSKGTPCRYVLITRGAKVVHLVAYRQGNQDSKVAEAKKFGAGTISCGVADGQGVNLSFKLLRTDGYDAPPIKASVLREYLAGGQLKVTPTIDIVDVLPPIPDEAAAAAGFVHRSADEWNAVVAAVEALADPEARRQAISNAIRDLGAAHIKVQQHLKADWQSIPAKQAAETIQRVTASLRQIQSALPPPPDTANAIPPLQPASPPAQPTAAPQAAPAQSSPPKPQAAAAAPPRPLRPGANAPTYASAAKTIAGEISNQLQSIFGAAERQQMLADCQADANSDFGKVVAALPRGGMSYAASLAAYQNARALAEKYLKSHRKPLIGKLEGKVQKAKDHCEKIIAAIDQQLAQVREQNEAAVNMARTYQGFVNRQRPVPPEAAAELQRLSELPLISDATRAELNNVCGAIFDPHWAELSTQGKAVKSRARNAGDYLSIQACAGGAPADANMAGQARLIGDALDRVDGLIKKQRYREAIDITREAVRMVKEVDDHVAPVLANPTGLAADWQKLQVRGRLQQLAATENLDKAADPKIAARYGKALQQLESGNPQAAIAKAQKASSEYDAALAKYEAAQRACASYGDLATLIRKDSEAAFAMSLFLEQSPQPQHQEMAAKARSFGLGGNDLLAAKGCFDRGQYVQAERFIKITKERLAAIRQGWMEVRGAEVKQAFDSRKASGAGPAEQEIAGRIGEGHYLEMLNLAESITQRNGFDPRGPELSAPMNPEELAAIYGYTTQDFNIINPLRRNLKPGHLIDQEWAKAQADYRQYNESLEAGLRKMPGYTGTVYRGGFVPDAVIAKLRQEMKFSDLAFVSTSFSHGFAGPYQVLIHAKGKNGKDVSSFSIYKDTEGEILFLPGTEFRVLQIIDDPSGKPDDKLFPGQTYIVMEEV